MSTSVNAAKPSDPAGLTLEAWAQGYMAGSLIIMAAITVANMRRHILLHKLILIELIFGLFQGFFIFPNAPYYGWYLSAAAIPLNISWVLHNVIAWMKNKPFFDKTTSTIYIVTVCMSIPYWFLEITANFIFFNPPYNSLFTRTRPFEALCRDPWWIFTVVSLFWNIKSKYDFGLVELCRVSPRFGILLFAMLLSVCFIICDILSVTNVISGSGLPDGINPFWKLAFVFKCLTDTVVLDDFKTALDRLKQYRMQKMGSHLPVSHIASGNGIALSRQFSPASWRARLTGHADVAESTFKAPVAGDWEAEIERLDFCTVPDQVYLGNKSSCSSGKNS